MEPDAKVKSRPRQVWSQCEDEDARHWFPCLDKPHVKMTTELRVRAPAGWVVLSNGERVDAKYRLTGRDLLHGARILLRRGKRQWHATRWA